MKKDVKALVGMLLLGVVAVTAGCLEEDSSGGAAGFAVAGVTPEADDSLVRMDAPLEIVFSTDVDPKTITVQTLSVKDLMSHQSVLGKVSYDEATRTATFVPYTDWMPDGHYRATVKHLIQSKQGGKHLPSTYSWEFSGPPEPAKVFHTEPYNGETDVSPKTEILVEFGGVMDAATITKAAFQLIDPTGAVVLADVNAPTVGSVGHGSGHDPFPPPIFGPNPGQRKAEHAVLNPASELKLGTTYTVRLASTIKTITGGSFAGQEWTFTTAATKTSTILIGSDQEDSASAVVANASGVYVLGTTTGALAATNVQGPQDLFLTKRDAAGAQVWMTQLGSPGYDSAQGLAVDADGTSYVGGYSDPNFVSRDPTTIQPPQQQPVTSQPIDGVLYKISATGQVVKTVSLGVTGNYASVDRVISDGAGSLYILGTFDGTLDGHTSLGATDAFLAKYDTNLTRVWLQVKGTVGFEGNGRIALGSNGSLYWTLSSDGDFSAPTKKPTTYNQKLMVFKSDTASGAVASGWPVKIGGEEARSAAGIGTDSAGNVYVGGTLYGDPFGFAPDLPDGFLVKLDPQTGTQSEPFQWGENWREDYSSMVVQADGTIYLAGLLDEMGRVETLPDGSQYQTNISRVYVTKVNFSSVPTVAWSKKIISKEHANASDLAISSTGEVVVVGTAHGSYDGQIPAGGGDAFFSRLNPSDGAVK